MNAILRQDTATPGRARSVEAIARDIVMREGGYVNDPDDPGGATKYGVTLATLRGLGIDLTGDGRTTALDVQRLSRDEAVAIFVEHYYRRPGLDRLPVCLQASVFDMYVNSGSNALRVLQRLLNEMGHDLIVDGQLGAQTLRAAHAAARVAPDHLPDAYGIARRDYYYRLGDARPASRKYCRRRSGGKGGWILRAEAFIRPRFHLSEAAHRARTSHWGTK